MLKNNPKGGVDSVHEDLCSPVIFDLILNMPSKGCNGEIFKESIKSQFSEAQVLTEVKGTVGWRLAHSIYREKQT